MLAFVRGLAAEFPPLRFGLVTDGSDVDFYGEFPVQEGLGFRIGVALDHDELSLHAGALRLEYFPVSDTRVLDSFAAVLRGLLRGTHRVIEYSSGNRSPHRAELQRREDGRWQPCGTWSRVHFPSFRQARERILMRGEPD